MHESLRLLDEALAISKKEAAALEAADDALLERLCGQRAALLQEAWEKREGCDPLHMSEALMALQEIQRTLRVRTQSLADEISAELKASRKESTRIKGYHKTVSSSDRAFYVSRLG